MFDMSSLVNTDWNCQFSIRALAALYIGYTHQGISTKSNGQIINGIYAINFCTQIIHYMAAYLRIPPNKNSVFAAPF